MLRFSEKNSDCECGLDYKIIYKNIKCAVTPKEGYATHICLCA